MNQEIRKIFAVNCRSCGSAVGFDIPSQSYRCSHCGVVNDRKEATAAWQLPGDSEKSGILIHGSSICCPACGGTAEYDPERGSFLCPWCGTETKEKIQEGPEWKKIQADNWTRIQRQEEVGECSSCGAKILYRKDEASETCAFCGGNMIRGILKGTEELPELIIPFVLTEEEAKQRLIDWVKDQRNTKDRRRVEQNISRLKGYYLPYRLIRGPLHGKAYRDLESRKFSFKGYLEHAVVNSSRQLDNLVLDAAEPFELSALRPFQEEYVGGHRVKLGDISEAELQTRSLEEAKEAYRPYITKALHNVDTEIQMEEGELLYIPILLPVYVLQIGRYLAVVNGQTGRGAVESSKKASTSKLWILEPLVLTGIAIILAAIFFGGYLPGIIEMGLLAGIMFFSIYSEGRNGLWFRKIYSGKKSKAERKNGELILSEGEDVLKNPFSVRPSFFEKEGDREVLVEPKFYSADRMVFTFLKLLVFTFLPGILAVILHGGIEGVQFQYGAAWYVMVGGFVIIYATRGLRWDIFNHPVFYEVLPDGSRKLFGDRKSRKLSILSTFHLDTREERKKLGGIWYGMLGFLIFLLLGSTMAMIY